MSPLQRTLVLFKPDAVRRGLVGHILARFEAKGMSIVALELRRIDRELADEHYAEHVEKAFYPPLRDFVTSGPLVAAVLEGDEAIEVVRALNGGSLDAPRVKVVIGDAFEYLRSNSAPFELVIADLPDPNNSGLARLYAKQFYRLVRQNLVPGGLFVTQATSPYFSSRAFWSIDATVRAGGFAHTYPYHLNVPSFGEWGFVLASDSVIETGTPRLAVATRYLTADTIPMHFQFDKDMLVTDAAVSTLDRPTILDDYLAGWQYYR